ncbi:transcription factor bHLH111-like isoform X2 [Malus sylvestris]|uniref:transcription factor bHLH111-like isoform X4 n=1 Tax=Malus domestica TaxID=3750 RepID=UPI000498D55A|nr:transcription factor bHLH111-like isoform X2 [Malus domestica]XP_050155360.1 transcription factor bHLH111-like isoform X2 [Malus sylvestris]
MRNADLLPSLPSHLFNFGNNIDIQMTNWDAQMNMNRKFGFCMGSKAFESDNQNNMRAGDFSLPLQQSSSLLTYQSAVNYPSGALRYDDISEQSMLLDKKISAPQFLDCQAIQNARKRPIEVDDLGRLVGDTTALNDLYNNKRNKMTNINSQQQWHQESSMEQQNNKLHHLPVRRSQKLSDKITALQKLVSPYGKTDTASVLQEASIYIMLLQEQIQNLVRMLSSSYKNAAALHPQESGSGQVLDLRSKGLCLVPVSITQKVTMEERSDHLATSRKVVIANHF